MVKKKKVGEVVYENLQKQSDSYDPIEIERVLQQDYLNSLIECCTIHKPIFESDFFIVVLTKREKLLANTFRNYFSARRSCPTPNYDQSVFAYNRSDDRIEYLWTIPDREVCFHLLTNKDRIVPEEQQLLSFVIKFKNGELMRLAQQYNGELNEQQLPDDQ